MNTILHIINPNTSGGLAYSSSGTVDLYEDVAMSLNYYIADIKEPQKRNTDYSKTITVPGTNNNNKLLAHIYEIGADRLYNPNHKVEARILHGGALVFKGYMRLARIRKLRGEKVEYDLELRGRLDDLFTNLQDTKLSDLTWTDLNHTYSRANITASWTGTSGSNYVYPFIDYGYMAGTTNTKIEHFLPAVYVKEAFDRIFRTAGFQYSSSFLTSSYFKSLIMPFTGDSMRLTPSQIEARDFRAQRSNSAQLFTPFTSSGTTTGPGTTQYFDVIYNDDSSTNNTDGGNNFNTSTGIYTVPASGTYTFCTNLTIDAIATPNLSNQYINQQVVFYPRMIINSVAKVYGQKHLLNFSGVSSSSTYSTVQTAQTVSNIYVSYTGKFAAGDTVYIDLQGYLTSWFTAPAGNNVTYQLRVNTGSYFYGKVDPLIKPGDTITFADTLPRDLKCKDFLLSIIKMHNLYFEYDKDTPNKIYIEPRDSYYNTTTQDWTEKLDASKEPEIIPMGALDVKRYRWTYKADGDVLNATYHKTYGEIYAEKYKDIDNDFLKNEEKMELVFSPTPLYGVVGTDRYYPAIYSVDSNMKIVHNKTMNPRILIYGGLKSCNKWYLFDGNIQGAQLTTYPFCGMMDDPELPDECMDFEAPREVYYTPAFNAQYSNNNLYNKYWKQFIEEVSDKNSSIVTAWFWLTPADIQQVDFRHVYQFLNQNFRLNKIYDYNPDEISLTKCEFIKIKNGIPFVKQKKKFAGGGVQDVWTGTSTRLPATPSIEQNGGSFGNIIGSTNIITGSLNYVSPSAYNVMLNGNSVTVGEEASNITILNSSGITVAGGLTNVTVLNSSGVTVLESNVIYENSVKTLGPLYPQRGTYTPVAGSSNNVTGIGFVQSNWSRVADMVTLSGEIGFTVTATATLTNINFSIPIQSTFENTYDAAGVAYQGVLSAGPGGIIVGDGTELLLRFVSTGTGSSSMSYIAQYRVV